MLRSWSLKTNQDGIERHAGDSGGGHVGGELVVEDVGPDGELVATGADRIGGESFAESA